MSIFPNGTGIFETVRTESGAPKFLDLHLERAKSSASSMKIALPNLNALDSNVAKFLASNPVATSGGRLRIEIRSNGKVELSHAPYVPWTEPARLTITNSKVDERSKTAGIKALPYAENLELLERARAAGFDEVIRFNSRNHICEAATANLLFKIRGEWVTPSLSSGCLPGITRALCLKWFEVKERTIDRDELADVESAFILSSLREVQPAICIGPHELVIDRAMEIEASARMRAHSLE